MRNGRKILHFVPQKLHKSFANVNPMPHIFPEGGRGGLQNSKFLILKPLPANVVKLLFHTKYYFCLIQKINYYVAKTSGTSMIRAFSFFTEKNKFNDI